MKTQFDSRIRVVSVENLRAMCARVSGVCHRFEVTGVSRSRVTVTYSNPNEYGTDHPMSAIYPCFPGGTADTENPYTVLSMLRVLNDNWNGDGWQAFDILHDCPVLWRSPVDCKWWTKDEIADQAKLAAEVIDEIITEESKGVQS